MPWGAATTLSRRNITGFYIATTPITGESHKIHTLDFCSSRCACAVFTMMISPADGPEHSHHEMASMPHPVIPALDETVDDGEPERKRVKGGFKVRPLPPYEDDHKTNDEIHGRVEFCPVVKSIMDTPQVQRLRFLKQLGES
jgi:hypothetical protein